MFSEFSTLGALIFNFLLSPGEGCIFFPSAATKQPPHFTLAGTWKTVTGHRPAADDAVSTSSIEEQ